MLQSLLIKNYLLIDELLISFEGGLTTITGETGAGKSIILGALSLILGDRANTKLLKNSDKKCVIEGQFDVSKLSINTFFEKHNLDYSELCILRRELLPSGKSRAFINDTPVSLVFLKELSMQLVDLHSQFANTLLGDAFFRMKLIDSVAGTNQLYKNYSIRYKAFKQLQSEVYELSEAAQKAQKDIDYYRFQVQQIDNANLGLDDELTQIEEELNVLEHAEDIKVKLQEVNNLLDGADDNIINNLNYCRQLLFKAGMHSQAINQLSQRVDDVIIEIRDMSDEAQAMEENTEISPDRIEILNQRLDLLNSLLGKFRVSEITELKNIRIEFAQKIGNTDEIENKLKEKQLELNKMQKDLIALAKELSLLRKKEFPVFNNKVVLMLQQMGIPYARFEVIHQELQDIGVLGLDNIIFKFSAHQTTSLQTVEKAASGGELSRIMLCLKSLMMEHDVVPSLIFDEIDTGVSGEIADSMGIIMQQMAAKMQIISITHLPQVAARGKHHYKVYKESTSNDTRTLIRLLNKNERVEEIASMISGKKITDTARKNANSLLKLASEF